MRLVWLSLLLVLISLPAPAAIFQVNRLIGAGGVVGQIETDGSLGPLTELNIIDWTLTLSDGVGTFDLFGPLSGANSQVAISGSPLSASPTALLFDFGAPSDSWLLFQNPAIGSGINYWCVETDQCSGSSNGEAVALQASEVVAGRTGVVAIAVRGEVPELSTVILTGFGLLALTYLRRRKSDR